MINAKNVYLYHTSIRRNNTSKTAENKKVATLLKNIAEMSTDACEISTTTSSCCSRCVITPLTAWCDYYVFHIPVLLLWVSTIRTVGEF